jgi:two-component system, cell cycle sensor histidine kinase and response regulator CckA
MLTEINSRAEVNPMSGQGRVNSTTVLLVDDDDQLRTFCRDRLAEKGFNVLEGDNGLEALLVAVNHDGTIDLLITDLEMPKISGDKLAQVLKAMRPTISVLYMSGAACQFELEPDCTFLPKPFLPDALLKLIGEALDARQHVNS